MSAFLAKIADGIDVAPLVAQLDAQPELWNTYPERRIGPHVGIDDVWVRYFSRDVLTTPDAYREKHPFVFYPAWAALPALKPIVAEVANLDNAHLLGGILITRIPAGGNVGWHHDRGGWHAETFDRKMYVTLRSNDRCVNYVGTEHATMAVGSCFYFDNLVDHCVVNDGETDRITLIVCLRRLGVVQ